MNKDLIKIIVILLGFVGAVVGLILLTDKKEADRWNNGYCSCGGKYEYTQAIGHAYTTTYIYQCDKCGNTIEVSKHR